MKLDLRRLCLIFGGVLLAVGLGMLSFWQWNIHSAAQKAEGYVQTIRTLIPSPQGAVPEMRQDNAMAVLSLDGQNFLGILEMPKYGSALPVSADWGKTGKYPCRFSGNVYDRSLQIGATCQQGQYDFYREIELGDPVYFTDTEGNRFSYQVTDIRYESHADQAALTRKDAALTLFIQNIYGFEYILIFCNTPA